MMDTNDIKKYLPKYLSAESYKELIAGLKDFPNNMDSRFYTKYLNDNVIYQGDGLSGCPTFNFLTMTRKDVHSIVISNTCDIDVSNERLFGSQIVYSPIIELDRYESILLQTIPREKIEAHLKSIKRQEITQILYLPSNGGALKESIVFLDRIFNVDNSFVKRDMLNELRTFSLSDYGSYVFLLKLSIHFTRIQDRVDRKSVRI